VDIAEHLAKHEDALRALAHTYAGNNPYLEDDCYQAGALALIEAHERFKHQSELLTYAYHDVKKAMLKQVLQVEPTYGITEDLEELQTQAEDQGNDTFNLAPLYGQSLPGLQSINQSVDTEMIAWVREAMSRLSPTDRVTLEASLGRTQRRAAESLGLPLVTYQRRLKEVQARLRAHFHLNFEQDHLAS
jgi:RNA polymerase sigma factor (sigma-70 family)